MFSRVKEKLLNVKQNVPLFNADEKDLKTDAINVRVGAEILQHFQNQWEEMHAINEENAKKANELSREIEQVSNKVVTSKQNVALITHILSNSNLSTNVATCLSKIKELYTLSDTLEKDLINLENLIDETAFENLKMQHQYHLTQYQLRKEESLGSFKTTLEENHSKKVTQYEAKKKNMLRERQQVFQDAFKNDLELYKNLGTLPETSQTRKQNGALLEEIQLDYDQSELDQFFSDNL